MSAGQVKKPGRLPYPEFPLRSGRTQKRSKILILPFLELLQFFFMHGASGMPAGKTDGFPGQTEKASFRAVRELFSRYLNYSRNAPFVKRLTNGFTFPAAGASSAGPSPEHGSCPSRSGLLRGCLVSALSFPPPPAFSFRAFLPALPSPSALRCGSRAAWRRPPFSPTCVRTAAS